MGRPPLTPTTTRPHGTGRSAGRGDAMRRPPLGALPRYRGLHWAPRRQHSWNVAASQGDACVAPTRWVAYVVVIPRPQTRGPRPLLFRCLQRERQLDPLAATPTARTLQPVPLACRMIHGRGTRSIGLGVQRARFAVAADIAGRGDSSTLVASCGTPSSVRVSMRSKTT